MKSVLQDVLDRLPEALGAAVVGLDGIVVEKVAAQSSFNIDLASAQAIGLVKRAGSMLHDPAADSLEEVSVTSRSGLTILRAVGGDYYLCVVLAPGCIPGRARYEVWKAGAQLERAVA